MRPVFAATGLPVLVRTPIATPFVIKFAPRTGFCRKSDKRRHASLTEFKPSGAGSILARQPAGSMNEKLGPMTLHVNPRAADVGNATPGRPLVTPEDWAATAAQSPAEIDCVTGIRR